MKRPIEQIQHELEVAERQLKAYQGNRHAQHNIEMAKILIASLQKELAERYKEKD